MSNHLLRILFFSLASGSTLLSAQVASIDLPDPALERQSSLIVLGGIAPAASDETYRTFFLSTEYPFGAYHHAGVLYSIYLPDNGSGYAHQDLQKGSYELGIFSKFFMHGRLSGRRSNLFFGPQLRFGLRKKIYTEGNASNAVTYNYRVSTSKFLFCLGGQHQLGHGVFEWSLPIGFEYARTSTNRPSDYSGLSATRLCVMPAIALGIRL